MKFRILNEEMCQHGFPNGPDFRYLLSTLRYAPRNPPRHQRPHPIVSNGIIMGHYKSAISTVYYLRISDLVISWRDKLRSDTNSICGIVSGSNLFSRVTNIVCSKSRAKTRRWSCLRLLVCREVLMVGPFWEASWVLRGYSFFKRRWKDRFMGQWEHFVCMKPRAENESSCLCGPTIFSFVKKTPLNCNGWGILNSYNVRFDTNFKMVNSHIYRFHKWMSEMNFPCSFEVLIYTISRIFMGSSMT